MAEESEKHTPVFDWDTGDFKRDLAGRIVTVTEGEACEQVAIKALQTARSFFTIYFDNEDPENHDKYGSEVQDIAVRRDLSENVKKAEIARAVKEALIYDPWVTDVYEIEIRKETAINEDGKAVLIDVVDLKIMTIFDKEVEVKGVSTNG